MNYYITGAGGFIGKHLVKYLKDRGDSVFGEDDNINGEYTVIHLSAYGNHYHQTNTDEVINANITQLINLISNCKPDPMLIKFYNFSTSSVTLKHQTLYSATKLVGEKIIESLNDPRFVNVRPYSVYGPGEADHRFIPTIIRCLKSGEQMPLDEDAVHDFIHVEDFIEAMFNGHTEIGSGEQTSNLGIVNMLQDISGKLLNYWPRLLRKYDTTDWRCPVGVPHRSLYDGLKQIWEESL